MISPRFCARSHSSRANRLSSLGTPPSAVARRASGAGTTAAAVVLEAGLPGAVAVSLHPGEPLCWLRGGGDGVGVGGLGP